MSATAPMLRPAFDRERKRHYDEEGLVVLRRVFSAGEMHEALDEADRLLIERCELISPRNLRCRFMKHVDTDEELFETFDPVIDIAPVCARLAADPRVLDVLRVIYDDEPCLFKDKLIFKYPGARGYGLHQDHPNWPGFPKSFVTAVIAYDRFDGRNGGTEVFRRQHLKGTLSPGTETYRELTFDEVDERAGVPLDLDPGDVAIFGCYVPHRSLPNRSGSCRRGLFLSYNARSDGGDQREAHYHEFHERMRSYAGAYARVNPYFR